MKNAMSSQRIPLRSRIESALAIYHGHRSGTFSNARSAVARHRWLCGQIDAYVGLPLRDTRILDLGCGQTATQTLLFHAGGAPVVGIDVEVPTYRLSPGALWLTLRQNGPERALKSLARHLLFDRKFFADLEREYGRPIDTRGLDTRVVDATRMPFDDSSFDFIYSLAVFEHIEDVPAAVHEMNRVLSPRGLAVVSPHLFPSLSGGHCLEWLRPDEPAARRVPPWDHLRGNHHPANVYLNRLRLRDYRAIFRTGMEVVNEEMVIEGERLLTPELEAELGRKGFAREDLLTAGVMFFARKRVAPAL